MNFPVALLKCKITPEQGACEVPEMALSNLSAFQPSLEKQLAAVFLRINVLSIGI
jgi:hypothetical protein